MVNCLFFFHWKSCFQLPNYTRHPVNIYKLGSLYKTTIIKAFEPKKKEKTKPSNRSMEAIRVGCLLCLFVLLILSVPASSQSHNISLGSSLAATKGNSTYWLSPSGDFAFGFQEVQSDGFLLAIWFNKIPEKTIVWSANRNTLVQSGSVVQVTAAGELLLEDRSGNQAWAASPVGAGVSYAAMLDTGNFVLASKDAVNLWQSFSHPTDTILPTQTLNQDGTLIARYAQTNYSNGRFKFILQTDGNLVMYSTDYPSTNNNFAYWTPQNPSFSGYQVIFNQSGYIFRVSQNGSIIDYVTSSPASTDKFYQRAIIDYDGVFRQYVYPKTGSSNGTWPMAWSTLSFIPSDICMSFAETTLGSGACGFNSYCTSNGSKPSCLCPPSYIFLDPQDVHLGCKPSFTSQTCANTPQDNSELFEIIDMPNTDWPGAFYAKFWSQTEDWCRQACLDDCYCAAAVFGDGNLCWKKAMPLLSGLTRTDKVVKGLLKVRKENSLAIPKGKDNSTLTLVLSVLLGSFGVLIILLMIALHRTRKVPVNVEMHQAAQVSNIRFFKNRELEAATGGFKEEVGSGGFGTVYKGFLPNEDAVVAVKKLDRIEREDQNEFINEVRIIGRTNHRNLVQLLGYCDEGQRQLLVYEYMSNGSLASHLFSDSRPRWFSRIQIAFGIARGLLYLHEECSTAIIHCDIKTQNILLDESLTAKISDFGLSKFMKIDQTRTMTRIRGTKGYLAPEWFQNLPITVKVDVYSFGIVLLELITCRRSVEHEMEAENWIILSDWACDCYRDESLHLLVEEDEEATDDMKRVEKFVKIAIWCIQQDPSLRPTMKKVTQMLEGAISVPNPPEPNSFMSTTI